MTFARRQIALTFSLTDDTLNEQGDNIVTLTGHRVEAIILNPGNNLNLGRMQLRVYGVDMDFIKKFSTYKINPLFVRDNRITVTAGDDLNGMHQVFEGTLLSAVPDFSGMPETTFDIYAQAAYFHQVKPAAANSYEGSTDVAEIVESLAKQMGFAFRNYGVDAKLSDPYLPGTLIRQLNRVVESARVVCSISNGIVSIWPNDGGLDDAPILLTPETGLVGYPVFTRRGIQVTAEFLADLELGRQVELRSSLPNATGTWFSQHVRHELTTVDPSGPWFTTTEMAPPGFYVRSF